MRAIFDKQSKRWEFCHAVYSDSAYFQGCWNVVEAIVESVWDCSWHPNRYQRMRRESDIPAGGHALARLPAGRHGMNDPRLGLLRMNKSVAFLWMAGTLVVGESRIFHRRRRRKAPNGEVALQRNDEVHRTFFTHNNVISVVFVGTSRKIRRSNYYKDHRISQLK